jgi:hypothetical protein
MAITVQVVLALIVPVLAALLVAVMVDLFLSQLMSPLGATMDDKAVPAQF